MADQLTAEEAAALVAGAGEEPPAEPDGLEARRQFECPDCDAAYTDKTTLRRHRIKVHGLRAGRRARRTAPPPTRTRPARPAGPTDELDPDVEVPLAVNNLGSLAGLVFPFVPYTAVTIAGYTDPETGREVVHSRAKVAGEIILPYARKDIRVLRWIARFNAAFRIEGALDVVVSLGAAAAVDTAATAAAIGGGDRSEAARMVADLGIKIGPAVVQPIRMAIPDVLEFVAQVEADERRARAEAEALAGNGHRPPRAPRRRGRKEAEVVAGGVKGT